MRGASVKPSDLNGDPSSVALLSRDQIPSAVEDVLSSTDFIDIHTHLFAPEFGKLGLRGIDELLTYHYLEAELFRSSPIRPEQYWALSKQEQADAIWRALFIENSPISEATRGIVAVLQAFGLPTNAPDLREARAFFDAQPAEGHVRRVFQLAGISEVVMTNDPLDPAESSVWMNGGRKTGNFTPYCGSTVSCGAGLAIGKYWLAKDTPLTSTPQGTR